MGGGITKKYVLVVIVVMVVVVIVVVIVEIVVVVIVVIAIEIITKYFHIRAEKGRHDIHAELNNSRAATDQVSREKVSLKKKSRMCPWFFSFFFHTCFFSLSFSVSFQNYFVVYHVVRCTV